MLTSTIYLLLKILYINFVHKQGSNNNSTSFDLQKNLSYKNITCMCLLFVWNMGANGKKHIYLSIYISASCLQHLRSINADAQSKARENRLTWSEERKPHSERGI